MPQTLNGVTIPAGPDIAYGPQAFTDSVNYGNFVSIFASIAARDAWAGAPDGALAYVRGDRLYQRQGAAWQYVAGVPPLFANVAARDAWANPPEGAVCTTADTHTRWYRTNTGWVSLKQGLVVPPVKLTGASGTTTAEAVITGASIT